MNQSLAYELTQVMPEVRITGLLRSLATFQQPTGADSSNPAGDLDDEGFPTGDYEDIVGLVDIACTAPPKKHSDDTAANSEKGIEQIMDDAPKHVLLDDYYPQVEEGWRNGWRVTIDGIVFDVMGAEPDSQHKMTRCYVREVNY